MYEAHLFADLRRSGLAFTAHDLRTREGRRSDYDLTVLGRRGDIKASTYFLLASRSYPLRHDFYLTRLFHPERREWVTLVLLQPAVWDELDGPAQPTAWEQVWEVLPGVAAVSLRGAPLIAVTYEDWKAHVRAKQQEVNDERDPGGPHPRRV